MTFLLDSSLWINAYAWASAWEKVPSKNLCPYLVIFLIYPNEEVKDPEFIKLFLVFLGNRSIIGLNVLILVDFLPYSSQICIILS